MFTHRVAQDKQLSKSLIWCQLVYAVSVVRPLQSFNMYFYLLSFIYYLLYIFLTLLFRLYLNPLKFLLEMLYLHQTFVYLLIILVFFYRYFLKTFAFSIFLFLDGFRESKISGTLLSKNVSGLVY